MNHKMNQLNISFDKLDISSSMSLLKRDVEMRVSTNPTEQGIRKHEMQLPCGTLELFCSDNPPQDDFERQVRGMVFFGQELILQSLPYSSEDVVTDNYDADWINEDWTGLEALEGTLIRVFYFAGGWFVTTHRRLDANRSIWGNSKSFGQILRESVRDRVGDPGQFWASLNKEFQYIFLLTATKQTRFVCRAGEKSTVYLYAITKNSGTEIVTPDESWSSWRQEQRRYTGEMAVKAVRKLRFPFKSQGLLFFNTKTMESRKLINSDYHKLFMIRGGNNPSIPNAYLEHIGDKHNKQLFRSIMEKDELEILNTYDQALDDLTEEMYSLYHRRFVAKEFTTTSPRKNKLLKIIHGEYCKKHQYINKNHIFFIITQCEKPLINQIIRENMKPESPTRKTKTPSRQVRTTELTEGVWSEKISHIPIDTPPPSPDN